MKRESGASLGGGLQAARGGQRVESAQRGFQGRRRQAVGAARRSLFQLDMGLTRRDLAPSHQTYRGTPTFFAFTTESDQGLGSPGQNERLDRPPARHHDRPGRALQGRASTRRRRADLDQGDRPALDRRCRRARPTGPRVTRKPTTTKTTTPSASRVARRAAVSAAAAADADAARGEAREKARVRAHAREARAAAVLAAAVRVAIAIGLRDPRAVSATIAGAPTAIVPARTATTLRSAVEVAAADGVAARSRPTRRPSITASEGYGLWLDPAIVDNPVYLKHWAKQRAIEVRLDPDSITIRRADVPGEPESDQTD